MLADKKRSTVIVQFETLTALRQSVIGKAKGRIRDNEGLVHELQELMKQLKQEGQKEIQEYNASLHKKKRKFAEMFQEKENKKSSAKSKKDKKKKKKKTTSSSDSKGQSSSDSTNDSDDGKGDAGGGGSEGEEDEQEILSHCSSSTQALSNPRPPRAPKEQRKTSSQASAVSRAKTDDDLWSNSKFAPASSEKENSQISDDLMEMLAEVLHANFKSASDTCISVWNFLELIEHKMHDDKCM